MESRRLDWGNSLFKWNEFIIIGYDIKFLRVERINKKLIKNLVTIKKLK